MAFRSGIHGMVKASTALGGSILEVLGPNAFTVDSSRVRYDVTPFQATNITEVPGFPNAKGTFGGAWNDEDTQLATGSAAAAGVDLELYPDTVNDPARLGEGPAYLDISMNCPAQGAVTLGGNWSAAGDFDLSALF